MTTINQLTRREQAACRHELVFVILQTANGVVQIRQACRDCGWLDKHNHAFAQHPDRGRYPLLIRTDRDEYAPPRRDYQSYLQSESWIERREAAKARCGRRCQLCGATGCTLHVHHNTYVRLGAELETDLTVLCSDCHEIFHDRAQLAEARAKRAA